MTLNNIIDDTFLQKVNEKAAKGLNLTQIANSLGITLEELRKLRKQFSEVEREYRRGRAAGAEEVASALYEKARNGENMTATIFYLKTRGGPQWRETQQVEQTVKMTVDDLLPEQREILDACLDNHY